MRRPLSARVPSTPSTCRRSAAQRRFIRTEPFLALLRGTVLSGCSVAARLAVRACVTPHTSNAVWLTSASSARVSPSSDSSRTLASPSTSPASQAQRAFPLRVRRLHVVCCARPLGCVWVRACVHACGRALGWMRLFLPWQLETRRATTPPGPSAASRASSRRCAPSVVGWFTLRGAR